MATLPVQESQVEGIAPANETLDSLTRDLVLDSILKHDKKQEKELKKIEEKQKDIKELADLQDWIQNQKSDNPDQKSFKIDDATKQKLEKAKELGVRIPEIKDGELTSGQLDSLDRSISTTIENKNTDINLMLQKSSRATSELNEIIAIARNLISGPHRSKQKIAGNMR